MTLALRILLVAACAMPHPAHAEPSDAGKMAAQDAVRDQYYSRKYELDDVFKKATDNHGTGIEALYGTRNFREILAGVAYRGGANNKWHRTASRDNRNPLPADGLGNLCEEGFAHSFYLYSTNFENAPAITQCSSPRSESQVLLYRQRNPTDEQDSYEMLKTVYETIKDNSRGPVYLHCWNGWHASGLIAAKILRQFCGLSAEEAVRYWDRNTDGHNSEPRYEGIRQRIREFVPYPEFAITGSEAAAICPPPGKF